MRRADSRVMGEPDAGGIPGLENSEGLRRVARRFRLLRLIGMAQVLTMILAFFLLLGTGLSFGTLFSSALAVVLGLISLRYINHSRQGRKL